MNTTIDNRTLTQTSVNEQRVNMEQEVKDWEKYSRQIVLAMSKRMAELGMTQQMLADKSGVSLGSIKRFEQQGLISLQHILHIAVVLNAAEDFANLFTRPNYNSIDELAKLKKEHIRKRARKK